MKKNNVEAQDEKAKSQKKLPKKVILCVLVAIVLVIVAVFGIKKIFCSKDISKTKATYTDAFFIKNKKGEYALFNDKGKNITGFIYESAGKILNNSAFVMKDNNEYAVINNKGKEIIPAGKYEYLSDYNGFYKAMVKDEYVLIN